MTIKRLRFALGIVALSTTAVFLTPAISSGELDLPGINARLDNHEARITSNEKEIQALQVTDAEATSSPVSPPLEQVAAPAPATPPAAPSESPQPTQTPTTQPTPLPELVPPVSVTQGGRTTTVISRN